MLRHLLAKIPARQRAALRTVAEAVFNAGPDRPFLAARRRYARLLSASGSAAPPRLLRISAFRRRIPASIESFEMLGRPDLRMVNVESIGTQVIFWTGHHWVAQHGAGLEIWEQLCSRSDRVAELGANVGYYAIAGARATHGKYRAFEPHPRSCAALRRNLELNGINNVEVVEAAVVTPPAPATVELMCTTGTDRAAPSGAMVRGSSFDDVVRDTESIVVAAVPFDEAIAGSDLLKIDVEGLEAKLLAGSWEQLRSSRPAIMIEIHDFNHDLRALVPRLLDDLDATAYAMHRDHLVPTERDQLVHGKLSELYRTWDFLIVPAERDAMVDGLVRR